jgi:leucyl-tRNA synthetase
MQDHDTAPKSTEAYDPKPEEAKWQQAWADAQVHQSGGQGPKRYILEMWPYPSGDLHMGHVRNYTLGDVFARYFRMQGDDVLHPMGWDALGLPAENQAILEKVAPQVRTPKNIARMRQQMVRLGLSYDWQRELTSYKPDYYRWNQWLFIKLLERDLVYRRESEVNYCGGCQTILANEQVQDDLTCWRGHPGVQKKKIPEWAFRITAYAQELLDGLDELSAWPDRVVNQQRNWLGRSTGAKVRFQVADRQQAVEVFTTRVDTLFGATYLVLAPEHALVQDIVSAEQRPQVEAFVARMAATDVTRRTDASAPKEGVFTGAWGLHPLTGARLPIYLANFVVAHYGTGAVMAVPAHDVRDAAFAAQYGLPKVQVVAPADGQTDGVITGPGTLMASGPFTGLDTETAKQALADELARLGAGAATVSWHLRDWGFSRQRYWGTPIPIIYCPTHGAVPVPVDALPVTLPNFEEVELTGEGGAPLARLERFVQAPCPTCGGPGRREVETMDTFVDSAWYFARFASPTHTGGPFDTEAANAWLPIDIYVGGPEHAVMHLLYFRFFTRAMRDLGLLAISEPAKRLLTQGMVNAPAWRCKTHGYRPHQGGPRVCPVCQEPQVMAVEKMSKSKFNGVDPMALIDAYGADTARLYVLFAAPPEKDLEWNHEGVEGLSRFVQRLWRLGAQLGPKVRGAEPCTAQHTLTGRGQAIRQALHRTLARVSQEMAGRNHFNTAIAALMELTNSCYEHRLHELAQTSEDDFPASVGQELLRLMAQMLAPFAPHLAETLWAQAGAPGLVAASRWPQVDATATVAETLTLAVQVGGKMRGQVQVSCDADEAAVLAAAAAEPNVARHLEGKTVVKKIVVKNRLVNFVVRP